MMKRYNVLAELVSVTLCAAAASTGVQGQAPPSAMDTARAELPWAFHVTAPGQQREDDGTVKRLPDSTLGYTVPEINNLFAPPDWYPDEHPPMPGVVGRGRTPDVRACSSCHLPNGLGHPESSSLAALPAAYIRQQMVDFQTGDRKNGGIMTPIARGMTDAEIDEVAEYFAGLPLTPWIRVVETETVPTTYVGPGNMRFEVLDPVGTEPLGQRIIVLPEDHVLAELRDSHSGFVANVPVGSVAAGERLATTGGDRTVRCSICHGADLKGQGPIPGFAGRSAIYTARQLYSFQNGLREGPWSDLMAEAVADLTTEDLIALSAYAASLEP
jgi:cytochrome c553